MANISFTGKAESAENVEPVKEPGANVSQEKNYVTIEQAKQLAAEAAEAAYRKAQGHSDRVTHLVKQRLDQVEASYKLINPGKEITEDERNQLRQRVITDVLTNPAEEASEDDREIAAVESWTQEVFKDFGFEVLEEDPEAQMLDYSSTSAFRKSLIVAMVTKAKRSEGPKPHTPTTLPTSSVGKVPRVSDNMRKDPAQLLALGLKR